MALPTTGLSLCAGIGGLDLGVELACPGYRSVVYVERDAFAAATLVARMEDSSLAPAPIWDDLATFDGRPWRGVVDLVTAGFPCQPFSVAGKQAGTADDRWIWPHIARILGEVRPEWILLENVRGFLAPSQHDAFAAVLGTLADLGMSATWGVFRASEAGAPHRRERWFLLGHTNGSIEGRQHEPIRRPEGRETTSRPSEAMGHSNDPRLEGWRGPEPLRANERPAWPPSPEVGHTDSQRCDGLDSRLQQRGPLEAGPEALRPSPQPHWPPSPECGPEDWPAGIPQPAVRRGADGIPDRVDRLRCLGNAVVPQQAALAFETLRTFAKPLTLSKP